MKWSVIALALALLLFGPQPATAAAPNRTQEAQSVVRLRPKPTGQIRMMLRQPACEEFAAPYHLSAEVYDGAKPVGHYTVWSCLSLADAQRQGIERDAAIREDARNRYGGAP